MIPLGNQHANKHSFGNYLSSYWPHMDHMGLFRNQFPPNGFRASCKTASRCATFKRALVSLTYSMGTPWFDLLKYFLYNFGCTLTNSSSSLPQSSINTFLPFSVCVKAFSMSNIATALCSCAYITNSRKTLSVFTVGYEPLLLLYLS